MPLVTKEKTNWKYLLLVVGIGLIASAGVLAAQKWLI